MSKQQSKEKGYICKQCGEEDEACWVCHCEICNKEGSTCCITPDFISKVGEGGDIDMYFCEECYKKFTDIFLKPVILPSFYPYVARFGKDKREAAEKTMKDGIRRIMSAMSK